MNKKVLSLVLSSVMVFASVATAFAATGDVHNADGTLFATGNEMNLSTAKKNTVNLQQSKYLYEYNSKQYTMLDAQASYVTAGGDMEKFATEIAKKTPVGDVSSDIKSVTGLTSSLAAQTAGQLEFAINGGTQAAKIADLTKAGYTVTFKATKKVLDSNAFFNNTGKTISLADKETFAYTVVIEKKNDVGELVEVAKSTDKTVTVSDYTNNVTAITSMEVMVGTAPISSKKIAVGDSTVTIKVMGRTADMKGTDKPVDITTKAALSSSNVLAATITTAGAVTATAIAPTDVTFTAKAGNITQTLTLNVGNEARVLSNKSVISPTTLKLAKEQTGTISINAKDQYGDPYTPGANGVTFAAITAVGGGATLLTCTESAVNVDAKGIVTVTVKVSTGAIAKESTEAIVLYDGANTAKTPIGKVTVTVVPTAGDTATWKLVPTNSVSKDSFVLDLNTGKASVSAIQAEGYNKDGVSTGVVEITGTAITTGWTLKSANDKLITVTTGAVNSTVSAIAGKVGSTTLSLVGPTGTVMATLDVTVKNSAPTIDSAKFKSTTATITNDEMTIALREILTVTAKEDGEIATVADFVNTDIKVGSVVCGTIVVVFDNGAVGDVIPTASIAMDGTVTFALASGQYTGSAKIMVKNAAGEQIGDVLTVKVTLTK